MVLRAAVVVWSALQFVGCKDSLRLYAKTRLAMDTVVRVTIYAGSEKEAEGAFEAAFAEIARLERLLNSYSPTSEVSRINQSAGLAPVQVSRDTIELLARAQEISAETGGAFDVTIGAVTRLWDFKRGVAADARAVAAATKLVGFRGLRLDREKREAFLEKRGAAIDPGGITKGFAADCVAALLERRGIKSGLIAMSGDIRVFGARPDGAPWDVQIRHPGRGEDEAMAVVSLRAGGVSTSGSYERFIRRDGGIDHHIFDPSTGRSTSSLVSVTVVAGDATRSDALATAIFALGVEKGRALLEKLDVDALLIDAAGRFHARERHHSFSRR